MIPGHCRKTPRAYAPIWGVTGDISHRTCARPTTAATIGLAKHELGHEYGKLALPRDADLRKHALEHRACGLLGDAGFSAASRGGRPDPPSEAIRASLGVSPKTSRIKDGSGGAPAWGSMTRTIARASVRKLSG